MNADDIQDLADAVKWAREQTPDPMRKWYGLKCPQCGQRFFNSLFGTWVNYDTHFLEHLITRLQNQ